jgi:NADH:ubiquinone oxidoreductase subunit 6 (subunit J)
MLEKIVFLILSVITLGSGLMVVTQRNLFRAALYLVLALFGVAGFFVLLSAGFLGVVQIFIYAGAIAILIIFAVMLTRNVMNPDSPQRNLQWGWAVGLSALLLVILILTFWPNEIEIPISGVTLGGVDWALADEGAPVAGVGDLGRALVDAEQYALPFELASVLLLVAMIGAVYVVFPRRATRAPESEVVELEANAEESQ